MNTKTKAISEGAMMLAMMGVVLLLNRQTANFFELMLFFLSVPLIIYEVKYGVSMAATLGVAAIILSFLLSTPTSIFYMAIAMLSGFIYGYGVLKEYKNQKILGITIVINLVSIYLTAVVFASIFGYNLNQEVNEILALLPKGEVSGLSVRKFVEEVILISYIGVSIIQAVAIHLVVHQLFRRLQLKTRPQTSMYDIRFPKMVAFIIIGVFFLYWGSGYVIVEELVHQIILAFYATCLLIAIADGGITILCYLKWKHNKRRYLFIAILACFIPIVQNIIALIGVFDIYEGFRAKMKEGVFHEVHRKN